MRVTWQLWVLAVLAVVLGAGLALQRQANAELRGMIALVRGQHREVERLQAERSLRVKAQVPAAELENLRADHAAIVRLRGEIEQAKTRLIELERAESAQPDHN